MTVRDTSREAYEFNCRHGITATTQMKVIETVVRIGIPINGLQVSKHSGLTINTVCGAVNKLVKRGMLKELSPKPCPHTGRMARRLILGDGQPVAPPPDILVAEGGPMQPMLL